MESLKTLALHSRHARPLQPKSWQIRVWSGFCKLETEFQRTAHQSSVSKERQHSHQRSGHRSNSKARCVTAGFTSPHSRKNNFICWYIWFYESENVLFISADAGLGGQLVSVAKGWVFILGWDIKEKFRNSPGKVACTHPG